MLYDNDCHTDRLRGQRVAVLGYGSQGRAQALNLRDSGAEIVIGLRAGSASIAAAERDGFTVRDLPDAVAGAQHVLMLVPDTVQPQVYAASVEPHLPAGASLVFSHGYCIRFGQIRPREDIDTIMVAPFGVGDQVRSVFERGGGVPGMIAVKHDASGEARDKALMLAGGLGFGRAGIIETDFAEETETDLFAEQAVLCGGMTHLITAAFETLTEAGYNPQIAYFSCLHEVKLLADLMHSRGIAGMRQSISPVAEYGDLTRGPRVIGAASRQAMRELLEEIRSGQFARELKAEFDAGSPTLNTAREASRQHASERVGRELRARMPWLQPKPDSDN